MEKYPIGTAFVDGRWSPENPFGSHDDDLIVVATHGESYRQSLREKFPMVLEIGDTDATLYFHDSQPYPRVVLYCIRYCSAIPDKELLSCYCLEGFLRDAHEYVEQILRWREYSPTFSARAMKTFAYALVQWAWEREQPESHKSEAFYTKRGIYQYAQSLGCPVLEKAILRESDREYTPEEIEECLKAAAWDYSTLATDDGVIVFEKERFPRRAERENGIPLFRESQEDVLEEISYGYLFPWRKHQEYLGWV